MVVYSEGAVPSFDWARVHFSRDNQLPVDAAEKSLMIDGISDYSLKNFPKSSISCVRASQGFLIKKTQFVIQDHNSRTFQVQSSGKYATDLDVNDSKNQ